MENQIKEIAILDDYRKKGNITEEEYQLKRKQIWETPPGKDEKGNLSLAGHLMDESRRRDLPFWARYERFVRHHDAWMKESVEHKQKAFAELAKDGFTSNMENLIAAYVIYGEANDIRFLQSLLVNCPDDLRMEYHNWYMAKIHGQAFLDQHGAAIQELAPIQQLGDNLQHSHHPHIRRWKNNSGCRRTESMF